MNKLARADCRAGQTTRYGGQTATTEQPYLLENAVGDLSSVHFGDKRAAGLDNGSYWMNIKGGGDRKFYDGFVVHCDNRTLGFAVQNGKVCLKVEKTGMTVVVRRFWRRK